MKHYRFLLLFLSISINALAQEQSDSSVTSIDGIINELLEEISIEKGEKMDTPAAQFTVADSIKAESVSLDDFLTLLKDPYYEEGYLEKEIHKVVDEYNGIAQVFQTFYGKDSEGVDDKGVNSYQLTYYKGRWWIVSLLWTMESKGKPIPAKYGGIK